MAIKAMIFDLDDTLYDESEYVNQAFENAADYLAGKLGREGRKEAFHRRMLELVEQNGRGKVFDLLCEEEGLDICIGELVEAYRSTRPSLKLYPDAEQILGELEERGIRTGLITDGCSRVQHEKISALGLDVRLDSVVVTDDFGICKPHAAAYRICLDALGCIPQEAAYVGDNPRKDFTGAGALGMKTFRIIREKGMYMNIQAEPGREAEYNIQSLTELTTWIHRI